MLYLLFLLLFVGVSPAPPSAPDDVLAVVGEDTVFATLFWEKYAEFVGQTGLNDSRDVRRAFFEHVIDNLLLGQEAVRRGLTDQPEVQTFTLRWLKKTVGTRYYEKHVLDTLSLPSEKTLRWAYVRDNERRVIRHLFFRDEAAALRAYARLKEGEDFLQLAAEVYHLPAIDSSAGLLGAVGYFDLDDPLAEVAFQLPADTFSAPVQSRYGYHILRVERIVRQPLLTEDGYRRARERLAWKVRMRRRRMEGNRFIRTLMNSCRVKTNDGAIAGIVRLVEEQVAGLQEEHPDLARLARVPVEVQEQLKETLDADTPLFRYACPGDTEAYFRVSDYLFWLPELPFQEIMHRPAASMGRALRNEVLARLGFREGLDQEREVQRRVIWQVRLFAGDVLRKALRGSEDTATPDLPLPVPANSPTAVQYGALPAGSEREARKLLAEITEGVRILPYREVSVDTLSEAWRNLLLHLPADHVGVGVVEGTWYVIGVKARRGAPADTHLTDASMPYRKYLLEIHLIRTLRANARIAYASDLERLLYGDLNP